MIAAQIQLLDPQPGWKFRDESPINVWLLEHVGPNASRLSLLNEQRPWHVDHQFGGLQYSFAREQDAVLFALRWS